MAAAMFLYLYYGKHFRKYREGFAFRQLSFVRMKKIFSIGATSGLQWVFEVGAFAFAMVMIGWIGKREQAAHQIALQIASVTYLFASGISAAASVRAGNQLGMKDIFTLRESALTAFIMVAITQSVFALMFIGLRFFLPSVFNEEPEVQAIVSSLLLIAALFQITDGIQVVGLGVLRGIKDIVIPTWITFICYWVIGLPCCYLFAFIFGWGVQGIWLGLTLALTLAAVCLFWRFNRVTQVLDFSNFRPKAQRST
jgi:MATE family multidrug resistance protein